MVDHTVGLPDILEGLEYPASVVEIVDCAQDNGADEDLLDQLQALPDRVYTGIRDIRRHFGAFESLPDHDHLESSSAQG